MRRFTLGILTATALLLAIVGPALARGATPQDQPIAHMVYFHQAGCSHCQAVEEEVLDALQAEYGSQVQIRKLMTTENATNYELLIRAEEVFEVAPDERGTPTLVIGDQILIGEQQIRERLPSLVEQGLAQGGIDWPEIPGLDQVIEEQGSLLGPAVGSSEQSIEVCEEDEDTCEERAPIWVAYFYEVGCQECSRAEADIAYLQEKYPQLLVEEFNMYDRAPLGMWLANRAGRAEAEAPAVFIGDEALIGEEEITTQNLEALVERHATTGAEKVWEDFQCETGREELTEWVRTLGPLAVILTGLWDGVNPCAIATLIFFISYLTISGRKGEEVLAVGGAFTLGVFLAYLAIGVGFYRVLGMLQEMLSTLRIWIHGITALLCGGLAVFSFLDFLKARRGEIGDMSLNLPHALRMRINAIIRKGRNAQSYVAWAFVTGILVSVLELACTGQTYAPIVFCVVSIPQLRVRALSYLLLYNLMFVVPLVIVFVLVYYGVTAKQLTDFLQQRAAAVKLGMTVMFVTLAALMLITL